MSPGSSRSNRSHDQGGMAGDPAGMRWRPQVLRRSLLIIMVCVALVPLAVAASFGYFQFRGLVHQEEMNHLRWHGERALHSLEIYLDSLRHGIVETSGSYTVAELSDQERMETRLARLFQRASVGCPEEGKWLVLGPFPRETVGSLSRAYIPEEAVEINRDATYPSRAGAVRWEARDDGRPDGLIEFDRLFPGLDWAVAYGWITLQSEREQPAVIHLGSDDQVQVWLNGTSIWQYTNARSFVLDQDTLPVTLCQGRNTILVKVCNERWHWKCQRA